LRLPDGLVCPGHTHSYGRADVQNAFRHLAPGKHHVRGRRSVQGGEHKG
jgi:hypothetical protein